MRIVVYDTLDSTNLEAQRLWVKTVTDAPSSAGPAEPLLVTAATQHAGLGRAGRSWLSPAGGLWMSLVWPLKQPLAAYQTAPLVAGLATAEALSECYSLSCQIKWPNDLLFQQRKLVGILCQGEPGQSTLGEANGGKDGGGGGAIIVGIGINANFPSALLGPGLRHPPISLLDVLGQPVDLTALRDAVTQRLVQQLTLLDQDPEGDNFARLLLPRLDDRLAWRNQVVHCSDTQGQRLASGTLEGLTAQGCIVIRPLEGVSPGPTAGRQILSIGELQLRAGAV